MKRKLLPAVFLLVASAVCAQTKLSGTPIGSTGWNYEQACTVDAAPNAFDGDLQTYYASHDRSYTWVGLDLGTAHVITRVGWSPRNDIYNGENRVVLGVIQGANQPDWLDAVPIYMITEKGVIGRMDYADIDVSRAFRYVRYIGPHDARCNIAELEFYGYEAKGDDSRLFRFTNLPMVVINTKDGQEPFDKETEIKSNIIIIDENGKVDINKPAGVRERGNYSRSLPKKPWRIKFDKKQSPLNAPAEGKKWTLVNNYGDKSLLRNVVSFEIARRFGMTYYPWVRLVEVVLNGEYKGVYTFGDQVDVRPGRVDIDEMDTADISGEALTGGYLLEIDGYADQEPAGEWFTSNKGMPVTIKSPDDGGTTEQYNYIKNYFNNIEDVLYSTDFTDPEKGYRNLLDVESFVKHILTNELCGNHDQCWSIYCYKKRNDPKLYFGPVWDFDLGFDNDWRCYPVCDRTKYSTYLFTTAGSDAGGVTRRMVRRIFIDDPATRDDISRIWSMAVNDRKLNIESLQQFVKDHAELLKDAQRLNFMRWPILDQRVHENPRDEPSFEIAVNNVLDFIEQRYTQLHGKLGYDPNISGISTVTDNTAHSLCADGLCIRCDDAEKTFSVYNLQGIRIFEGKGSTGPLAPGLYIATVGPASVKLLIR